MNESLFEVYQALIDVLKRGLNTIQNFMYPSEIFIVEDKISCNGIFQIPNAFTITMMNTQ